MMIDVKYHLGSLVAIFFALGIGILIGAVAFQDRVVVGQESVIEDLEQRFAALQNDKVGLERELKATTANMTETEKLLTSLLPILTKDRLKGLEVVVLSIGAKKQNLDALASLIEEAGGVYSGFLSINEAKDFTEESMAAALNISLPPEEVQTTVGHAISDLLATGHRDEIAIGLMETGLIAEIDIDANEPDCFVVLNPGSNSGKSPLGIEVALRALKERGCQVLGATVSKAQPVGLYERVDIEYVPNISSSVGKFKLVDALIGVLNKCQK